MNNNKTPKEGPFVNTDKAKATPGKTVKTGGTVVIKKEGMKPMAFTKGSLHKILNVPQDENIPDDKMQDALAGRYGAVAKRKAMFAENVLKTGRKTGIKNKN